MARAARKEASTESALISDLVSLVDNGAPTQPDPMTTKQSSTASAPIATGGKIIPLGEVSKSLSELIDRAVELSGLTRKKFEALPGSEKNAFLAQARGEVNTGTDSTRERLDVHPRQLVRSKWNREKFDPEKMQTLVESIREHGILQPLLARPWQPETLVDKELFEQARARGERMFEIVAGERRWHAATAVSLERVPVTVRQLTDEQAIELQAIENLQREDLTAIDEAEKYRQLRDLYKGQGLSTEQAVERIKDRVGRSRAAIFGALKLLDLPETTQERVRAGEIPKSQAEELAKIKDPERVELVARAILKDENGGARREALPVRQVRELVEFEKIREKNLQAYNVKRAEAEANGWHILTAEESAAILDCHTNGHWWLKHGAGYVRDETTCQLAGANYKSYRQLWKKGEWPTVTLAQLKDGRPVEIYGERAADMAAKAGGKLNTNPETGRASTKTPEQREAEENLKIRQTTFDQLVERVVSAEEARPESPEVWRMIAKGLTHSTHHDTLRAVCKRRGLDHVDGYADAIEAAVEKMTMAETRALVSEMILTRFKPCPYSTGYSEQLQNAAPVFGLDLQAIETEVQTSGLHKAKRKKA